MGELSISPELIMLMAALTLLAGVVLGNVGARFGFPVLLLFLITGMLFGTDGVGIEFSNMDVAKNIGMLALTVIIFTGGMDTNIGEMKKVVLPGVVLSTVGVILTTFFSGCLIYLITNSLFHTMTLSLPLSILLSATISSTDSASVFAVLRSQQIHLKQNIRPLLELESGSNDPMAFMVILAVIQYINMPASNAIGDILLLFLSEFLFGAVGGVLFGYLSVLSLNKLKSCNVMLYPIFLLAIVVITFSTVTLVLGNGFLAVYIAGLIIANSPIEKRKPILSFFEGITWLFQITLFILLGLLLNPSQLIPLIIPSFVIALIIMVLGRPLAVMISLLPFNQFTLKAKLFISWIGLRGAAPILFAIYPIVHHVEGADQFYSIVFMVTLLSLVTQGMTVAPLSRFLKLSTPAKAEGNFIGFDLPEDTGAVMEERKVTKSLLKNGYQLKDLPLQANELVILVKRGDRFIVPKGLLILKLNDILLIVSQSAAKNDDISKENSYNLFHRIKYLLMQK